MSTATHAPMPAGNDQRTFLGHPVGLYVLFFTEMWERFSFYSMRAFLVLYMTKALIISKQMSNEMYGAYLGFVYAAPFIGGMLADRLLGQRRCIVIGGILMAAAQFSLAAHSLLIPEAVEGQETIEMAWGLHALFFLSLGLMSAGNGFFKPNISSIVGSLYEQNDPRRDGAFTIFYMGINIGALLAGLSGQAAGKWGWHWGFLLAGVGMILGQVIFGAGSGKLMGKGLPPTKKASGEPTGRSNRIFQVTLGVAVFVPLSAYLIANPTYVQMLAVFVAVPILAYLLWEAARGTKEERGRMFVIIILCSFCSLFWAFFELAGSAVNLFTDEHVQRTLPWVGELEASFLTASINPAYIILMGFPFAKLWVWLDKRRMEPSSPLKFALGLVQLGAGFFVMYLGAVQAGTTGKCNLLFLVFGFFLHTTGELCLSPVGLSTMTKLSPTRLVSTIMGVWFLSSALGNVLGGWIGGKTEHYGFDVVFMWIAIVCVCAGLFLLLLTPPLKKMMHGVK